MRKLVLIAALALSLVFSRQGEAAIAFVQGPAAHTSTASTNVTTFASAVTVGNLVVVAVTRIYGGNPPRQISGIADNAAGGSNTYTLSKHLEASSGDCFVDIYYSVIARGGVLKVTVTFTGGSCDSAVGINEYSGVSATPADVVNGNQGTTTPATPGSVTPTGTCLYVAVSSNVNGVVVTKPVAWSQRQYIQSSSVSPISVIDYISSGAQNPSSTLGGSGRWVDVIATFKEAAAAGSSIKTVDGLAKASAKTVNGLAIGSVKSIMGLQ